MPRSSVRAGGLEVALKSAFRRRPGIWFGWSGELAKPGFVQSRIVTTDKLSFVVTDLPREDYNGYYNGFANRVLWPILHYRLDLAEFSRVDLGGYTRVNDHFAAELEKVLEPDDLIWVHDYHLFPFARALRQRGHRNKIGFFLHTPFPPPEIITALPHHERIVSALCDYDLVGFQTDIDAANFARYVETECRLTPMGPRQFAGVDHITRIGVFPVGIETGSFGRLARQALRSPFMKEVQTSLSGRALLIGVDRLDYSKGIDLRMLAFERFLAANPEWRNNVTFLQITPKSRATIQEYAEMAKAVSAAAGRINGTYGEASWTPIRYVNRAHSRTNLASLYRTARAALVTPLRDGMNLVAKEYIASQDPEDPGVLILSRFAGAAVECRPALLVNPYDLEAVGAAILRALSMPLEERRARYEAIMSVLSANDIQDWPEKFLTALTNPPATHEMASGSGAVSSNIIPLRKP
ncbi:MAG: trehalose-6-phosphate synthase [Pseudorhodoplanes sp.]